MEKFKNMMVVITTIAFCIFVVVYSTDTLSRAGAITRTTVELMKECTAKVRGDNIAGYQKLDYCKGLVKELTEIKPVYYSTAYARHFSFWRCIEAVKQERGIDLQMQTPMCIDYVRQIEEQ